jgi:hypothetical protein
MNEPITETDDTEITETAAPASDDIDSTPVDNAGGVQISIDSPTARAPEHVRLPERYRDTETTSLADDRNWSRHLESNWGF